MMEEVAQVEEAMGEEEMVAARWAVVTAEGVCGLPGGGGGGGECTAWGGVMILPRAVVANEIGS